MKPHIQKLPLSEHSSFVADTFFTPHFETPWHYHSEYELVLILQGKGKRFVGNHVSDYEEGNLTFMGPDVPHLFRKEEPEATGGSLVIHFKEDFLGNDFKRIPEMQKLKQLFQKARMGLHITGSTRELISQKMNNMLQLQGMERLICLLSILTVLANTGEFELLSSSEISGQNSRDNDRLNKVFDYVMSNFKNEIQVGKVAEIANMSYSGFCRYFKNRTKKNFTHFVNEIRIGYACKRLMESDVSVSNVCYESGYNNLTNFNEQFKKILKCTPYQFQRQHKV
ncbi:AraC family transcriptional regulator [Pontibacter sp. 13R65]|uniref:AraC family transcriptional regulator n=1 Tax=Pontibacter sp. 13R65 TaxID=3127458 RepID=UPI00301BD9A4